MCGKLAEQFPVPRFDRRQRRPQQSPGRIARASRAQQFSGSFPYLIGRVRPPARRRSRCGEEPDPHEIGANHCVAD
jgi:hypothetical protein